MFCDKSRLESLQRDSTELLALGKFDLRGWRHSDIESNFDFQDNQQKSDPQEIQVLGLVWNVKEDTFSISYRETESKEEVTKRRILSLAHRIFDPIGFTCPITLIPKLLIQECWKIEASWDSKLPIDIEKNVDVTYWSDSMDALHWIERDGPWATFVANRVEEIRRLSSKENWRYVPGMQNPADLTSRGCSVKTLKKVRWWERSILA
ncbi:uncharacterized protein TNIN_485571 [Trichonephila inaurata madagascariensis]|uniref:Uncharacterized protein n=1 Tax=Trichonephila inaurata madagascariensis TaxID=2747483 RepID=A0A8X6IXL0_9ARAC|nr:uncharacterized protein TNIN_485571 [Trichonephila inaurata madagascariensis]